MRANKEQKPSVFCRPYSGLNTRLFKNCIPCWAHCTQWDSSLYWRI